MSAQASLPKAMLYHDPHSPWSSAVRIAIEEKGYGADELDLKVVNLQKGENFSPTFLRLNPKGTVPTLIVPYENTLDVDTESRYKAVTDITAIVDLLDRSRTAISRTHTTSQRAAPSLSPATIHLSSLSTTLISLLHSAPASPELLFLFNARNTSELSSLSETLLPFVKGRLDALDTYLRENEKSEIRVSEKTRGFWVDKRKATEEIVGVVEKGGKPDGELNEEEKKQRAEYFENSKAAWEVGLGLVLNKFDKEVIGPYTLGDQFSVADIHFGAWLGWIIQLSGGNPLTDTGNEAIKKIEAHVGGGFVLPKALVVSSATGAGVDGNVNGGVALATDMMTPAQPVPRAKLAVVWDAIRERESWKKVYGA